MFPCPDCRDNFQTKRLLFKHIRAVHKKEPSLWSFSCGHCEVTCTSSKNLIRHLRNIHKFNNSIQCNACPKIFGNESYLHAHKSREHPVVSSSTMTTTTEVNWASIPQVSKTVLALNSHFKILRLDVQTESVDPLAFIWSNRANIGLLIDQEITNQGIFRVGLCLQVVLSKPCTEETISPHFSSRLVRAVESIDNADLDELIDQVLRQLNVFCSGGSGWILEQLSSLDIKICHTRSLAGTSFLPTPAKLEGMRKCLLNIKNLFDNFCFIYCILAYLYPRSKNRERPSQYRDKFNRLKFSESMMPMKLKDIARFESDNNLSITVFNFDEQGGLICCHRSRNRGKYPKIFLLLLLDGFNSHYCLITNFQAFMHKVCRSPKRAAKGPKTKFCVNCMQSIGKQKFMEHARLCDDNQPLRIVMPSEHLKLTFSNWEKTQKCPFVVYADLEALNVPMFIQSGSKTVLIEKQLPASYGAVLVDSQSNKVVDESFYRGEDCIEKLMNCLRKWNAWCDSERQRYRFLSDVLTKTQQEQFLASTRGEKCCICKSVIQDDPVIHHCHSSGMIFGIAHSMCNLKAQIKRFLPVFFHNLSRYDSHHILKNINVLPGEKFSAISRTDEIYISFSLRIKVSEYKRKDGKVVALYSEIRFLGSFQFMSQSLDSLARTMESSSLILLRRKFSHLNDADFRKVRGKGYFPYSFLNSFERFSDPFPAYGDAWRNSLTSKIDITEDQYQTAKDMFNLMQCKDFGDYHDLYLTLDVYLLADIFQAFRDVSVKEYQLDPAHFFFSSQLELESDADHHQS